jgi:transcriptional regulator with XRE-family HTH domain
MTGISLVAATALRTARLSAGLSQPQLAAAIDAEVERVSAWEDGSELLADVAYPVIERLGAALAAAGADPRLVGDLTAGIWCDLVIAALADYGDASCLLADPIAAEDAFRELLAWSAGGARPERYRPFAGPGPLLPSQAARTMAGHLVKLTASHPPTTRCAA